ncbi:MAG: NUDIX domain-containing protein [Mycobacteriales bacterium]
MSESPAGAVVFSRKERFHNSFFRLVTDELRLETPTSSASSNSSTVRRDYIADHVGAVGVVAYNESADAVMLVQQYRHPVQRELWELPAGLLDVATESALDCARRELAEETDLTAARWDVLVDLLVSPGSSDEAIRIFLAREITALPEHQRQQRIDEEAAMLSMWVSLPTAIARVMVGEIENAACVAGLLALHSTKNAQWPPLRPAEANWGARPHR